MENIIKTGIRWILFGLAFLIILFAVLIILLRYSTPILNSKKEYFVKWSEQVLQVPVSIQSVEAQWRRFSPEITLINVNVGGKKSDQLNLHIQKLSVSIDIWHSLLNLKLLPNQVDIDGAKIAIYQNKAQKNTLNKPEAQIDLVTWQELESISYWLLSQADVYVSRVNIYWVSKTGDILPLHNVTLQIVNEPWRHSITGSFQIPNAKPTEVKFIAKNISAPLSLSNLKAQAYIKIKNADVLQWLRFIPYSFDAVQVKKGLIDGEWWVYWEGGIIKKIQSMLTIHELDLNYLKKQHVILSDFRGNFAWEPLHSGWKFSADRLKGSINNHPWEETRISVAKSDTHYALSVGYLRMQDLHILLALDLLPSNVADILNEIKPHGEIKDLMLSVALPLSLNDLKISAKLINLSVQAYKKYPGFSGLNASVNMDRNLAQAKFYGVNLAFSKKWPNLENLEGNFLWAGQKISLDHVRGAILENPIEISMAKIDDLRKPVLVIQGSSNTDFSRALPVIFHSPLSVKQDFSAFSLKGPLHLDLGLSIPFSKAKTQVQGQVQFQNASIIFGTPWLNVSQLNGQFSFVNNAFSSKLIQGVFLEEPITMLLSTPPKNADNLLININGKLSVTALKKHISEQALKDFSGLTNFNTKIMIQGFGKNSQISAATSGDLQGIGISNIPAPFSKRPEEPRSFNVVATYRAASSLRIQVAYANLLSAALKFHQANFSLLNGEIHLGPGAANFQELPNLLITANLASVNGSEWQTYLNTYRSEDSGGLLKIIREMQLHIASLNLFNNVWPNVNLQITPGEKSMSVRVESPLATGELDIPFESGQVLWLDFKNLSWPETNGVGNKSLDPGLIPSINAKIQNLQYGKKSLGSVQFISTRYQEGMTIDKLTSHLPNADLALNGYWHKFGAKQSTLLQGYLSTKDLGSLFTQWNYPRTLEGGEGTIIVRLTWPDSLFNFSPEILNGTLKINLKKGSILKISQSAQSNLSLSRLINILNISTLPKLLTLDIRGVKGTGLPFSEMKGDFTFSGGSAYTNNFYMNGSVAQIWLQGKMGFADQSYDLTLRVAPYVTASLPVIAGVAGGPVVGGVAWVAEKFVGSTIGKAIGKTYKVTGTWKNPIITKVEKTR